MRESSTGMTRRTFVANAVVLPALAGLLLAETANADAKTSKAQVKYQATPKTGQKCSLCTFFMPGSSSTATERARSSTARLVPTAGARRFRRNRNGAS